MLQCFFPCNECSKKKLAIVQWIDNYHVKKNIYNQKLSSVVSNPVVGYQNENTLLLFDST